VFAKSIALRGGRIPLLGRHALDRWPFGAVQRWIDTDDDLGFEAKISRTVAGDELLELVNDGAVAGISVGAQPITNRTIPGGVQRVEAKLLELSVCTFPQLSGAEILSVREQPDALVDAGTPRLDAARAFLSRVNG
jgi:HK97 family phage prohead protease